MSYDFHLVCFVIQGSHNQAARVEDNSQWIQRSVWDFVYGSGNWQPRTYSATSEVMWTPEIIRSHRELRVFVSVHEFFSAYSLLG